jgi:hypothetical protein
VIAVVFVPYIIIIHYVFTHLFYSQFLKVVCVSIESFLLYLSRADIHVSQCAAALLGTLSILEVTCHPLSNMAIEFYCLMTHSYSHSYYFPLRLWR